MFWRFLSLFLFLTLTLGTSDLKSQISELSGLTDRPNVIFIIMDATRADHLSCYGYHRKTSENIDRIAEQGTLYEQCISPASWTLPSLASFFTGLHPKSHRVTSKNLILRASYPNLTVQLKKAGYRTQGFSCNAWVGEFSGLDRGFEHVEDIWRGLNSSSTDSGANSANQLALKWIDSLDKAEPFFAFIHYMEPHFPYRPPEPFDRSYTESDMEKEIVKRVRSWDSPRELGFILKDPESLISPTELEVLRAQYDGEIKYLDGKIGELVEALSQRGLLDNSILIITADHGEHIGDHGLLDHKMSVYDSLIRVPLIIRYPSHFASGLKIRRQVQTIDLFTTLVALCGLEKAKTEGTSLLQNPLPGEEKRTTFSEFARPLLFIDVIERHFPMADYSRIDRALLSVRTDRYKLIRASDKRHELYDLLSDPQEQRNLIDQMPEVANLLLEEAARFKED